MNDVFESAQHRRTFFAATILLLGGLVALRFYLSISSGTPSPNAAAIWVSLLDNLLSGVFASILVGGTIYFFRPRRTSSGNVFHLNANEIVPGFDASLSTASHWLFVGNRGRYLRSKVLPGLAARGGSSPVEVILLDPCSTLVCQSFVDYKSSSKKMSSDEGMWTVERIQAEIVATTAVCAWNVKNLHLTVSLFLAPTFSPIRMDSDTTTTFLTAENKREPAIVFKAPHFYNDWLMHHFAVVKRQSRAIVLPAIAAQSLSQISRLEIEACCAAIGLSSPSATLLDAALVTARTNTDPYA